ncbi:MAG: hypothetical protein HQK91_14305 [Nitrospirae bacterium]|nr:hypothetical protein [Nitrospirota bacterium]
MLEKYYKQAFAYYMIILSSKKNVTPEILMKLEAEYGSVPPQPFVDCRSLTSSLDEFYIIKKFEEEEDHRAEHDADSKLEELINNGRTKK